ncbi:MAG: DinB family protein [Ignavibacteriae bacterium]|nr:DinB family protein [Ignavibacteriota bacterium]
MNFNINEAITILRNTPKALSHLLERFPKELLTGNEGENTFSVFDVVGHLVHGEDTDWIPRAKIILAQEENRTFETFDRFAQFTRFKNGTIEELLELFSSKREQNLATLKSWNLTREQLALTGNHPALGEVTLQQLIATWVVHDFSHISQMMRVMAKQYSEDVGAWKEYLSILRSR